MSYKVETARGFQGPVRRRAGIAVSRIEPVFIDELTEEQVVAIQEDPWLVLTVLEAKADETTPSAPTKAELLAAAEAEGLVLEGINSKSKVADIEAAIAAARAAKADETTPSAENKEA